MSPDGKLDFFLQPIHSWSTGCSITYQEKPVVISSSLGLNGWDRGFALTDVSLFKRDTTWKPVYGERSLVRDHYQEMIVTLLLNSDEN